MMRRLLTVVAVICVFASALPLVAQDAKPYHDGTVWDVQFIHAKAGMEDRYLRYVANEWKKEQEAMKKAGLILSYKVLSTEAHSPTDFNVVLMTEFKDLTSMEANADKAEKMMEQLFGGAPKVEQGYVDRSTYRDILGGRLAREIVLEPKK
jgi:hypothetical protein